MPEQEQNSRIWQPLLAEEILPDDLREIYSGRRRRPYSELKRTTDFNLELALSDGDDGHFRIAQGLIGVMTEKKLSYGDKSLKTFYPVARIFKAQLPVFEERLRGFDLPISTMDIAHNGMVRILNSRTHRRKPNCSRIPLYDSLRAELEIASLLSRIGKAALFPYFATSREECRHENPQYNHDLYVVRKTGQKVPIQVKSSLKERTKHYDPSLLVICRRELESVAPDVEVQHGGISRLLAKECLGGTSYKERRRLNSMSEYIEGRITDLQDS